MTIVRDATRQDLDAIKQVYLRAFPEAEAYTVAKLACDLLGEATDPPSLAIVADEGGSVVGHIALSPVGVDGADGFSGYLLSPLAVSPECQGRGVGRLLIEAGLERLRVLRCDVVLVYGDPALYGRFGFTAANAERFAPPYELQFPFGWLASRLSDHGLPEKTVPVTCAGPLCDPALW